MNLKKKIGTMNFTILVDRRQWRRDWEVINYIQTPNTNWEANISCNEYVPWRSRQRKPEIVWGVDMEKYKQFAKIAKCTSELAGFYGCPTFTTRRPPPSPARRRKPAPKPRRSLSAQKLSTRPSCSTVCVVATGNRCPNPAGLCRRRKPVAVVE